LDLMLEIQRLQAIEGDPKDLLARSKDLRVAWETAPIGISDNTFAYETLFRDPTVYVLPEFKVTRADYKVVEIQSIHTKTAIFCPGHADGNPSAFINIAPCGRRMIYCASCSKGEDHVWEMFVGKKTWVYFRYRR
jgi:hypothetical protein